MKSLNNTNNGVKASRTIRTDYKALRKINPEAARRAVLDYLKTNSQNISEAAASFGINRTVVYDIIRRSKDGNGNLKDRPRVPKSQPRKTPREIENKIIEIKNKVQLSPKKLAEYLKKNEGISIATGTIRHIIQRAEKKHRLIDIHLAGG
ncbi:helix-turn-helix domain-containing protein [Thermodesulfobacteriota bacterium]